MTPDARFVSTEPPLHAAGRAGLATTGNQQLRPLGHQHEGDLGVPGREAFTTPAGAPPHHLYVCALGTPALDRHLALRDALRADPAVAAAYGDLKRTLAARLSHDRNAYTEAKSAFIEQVLATSPRRPASVATVSGRGRPALATMWFLLEADRLWFHTAEPPGLPDDDRVRRLYGRYVDAWSPKWERQATSPGYRLWSMSPERGMAVAYPGLEDSPAYRWSEPSGLFRLGG